jgi:hypothetical protein
MGVSPVPCLGKAARANPALSIAITQSSLCGHQKVQQLYQLAQARNGQEQEARGRCARASVATAVDLVDEEGGEPLAKRPNSSVLEGGEYAMGALAGDPRAKTHYAGQE